MFSVLTGQITDWTWPNNDAMSTSERISNYGDTCVGHGGSDVFPFGLLDTDIDGFEVRAWNEGEEEGTAAAFFFLVHCLCVVCACVHARESPLGSLFPAGGEQNLKAVFLRNGEGRRSLRDKRQSSSHLFWKGGKIISSSFFLAPRGGTRRGFAV